MKKSLGLLIKTDRVAMLQCEYWYWDKLKSQGFVNENGCRIGEWVFYNENRFLEQKGSYNLGLKQGPWFEYCGTSKNRVVSITIYKDDLKKEFIIEYFGNRISIINKPQDWEEQLINILNILKEKYKWDNPDLKPTEILVSKEGKLGIIDFGWCTLNNDYKCGKGYKNNKYIDLSENIIINLRKKFM